MFEKHLLVKEGEGVGQEESQIIYTLAPSAKNCKPLMKRELQTFIGAWSQFFPKLFFRF